MVDQQLEQEDKFDVPADYRLPDLAGLGPKRSGWETAAYQIENTYFDTPSALLAQFGLTLRRRVGGADAGWHLKVPEVDGRMEIRDNTTAHTLPDDLAQLLVGVQADEVVAPVAQVTVARTVHRLSRDGTVLVEVADDRVQGVTMGDAARISTWREVEVELMAEGDPRLPKRIGERLRAAGARKSAFSSKFQRTMGLPAHARQSADLSTVGGVAWAYLAEQTREIVRCDIRVRLDEPLVHPFLVAIGRLRSTLKVFAPLFEAGPAAQLEAELVWVGALLGEVRDRDILLARLAGQLRELPAEVVLGSVAAHIETILLAERSQHRDRLAEAMAGDRYQQLMKMVLRWQTQPPLSRRASQPAAEVARFVRRAEKKVNRRLAGANDDGDALPGIRRAAEHYRYAAELSRPVLGKKAGRIVKATSKLQALLEEHRDSVVSADFVRRMGAEAGAGGEQNGFTYGFLMADERRRARQLREKATGLTRLRR